MGEKGKRLCNKRYEEIKFAVVSLYEKYDIHCTPVSGFEIATKMGAKLKPYSTFSTADQNFIRAKFPDGCSWNENGVSYIAYNDDKKYTRHRKPDGVIVYGIYKGVRIGVIKTHGKIATVFPDSDQSSVINRRRKKR